MSTWNRLSCRINKRRTTKRRITKRRTNKSRTNKHRIKKHNISNLPTPAMESIQWGEQLWNRQWLIRTIDLKRQPQSLTDGSCQLMPLTNTVIRTPLALVRSMTNSAIQLLLAMVKKLTSLVILSLRNLALEWTSMVIRFLLDMVRRISIKITWVCEAAIWASSPLVTKVMEWNKSTRSSSKFKRKKRKSNWKRLKRRERL